MSMFWKNKTFDESAYRDEINSFTQSDIDSILTNQNALKVTVTRHPLARFASAWAQKFKEFGEFDKGKEQWLRDWPGLKELLINGTTHRIPFDSFVDYFLSIGPNKGRCIQFCQIKLKSQIYHLLVKFNPHWRLASDSCEVCSRPYDYIVKEETADSDIIFITNKFNLTLQSSFYSSMKGKSVMSNNGRAYTRWEGRFLRRLNPF